MCSRHRGIKKDNNSTKRNMVRNQNINTGNGETNHAVNYKSTMDRCKYLYDLVNMWIANTDGKVSSSSEVLSVVFALFSFGGISIYGDLIGKGDLSKLQILCLITLGLGFLLMAISLFILLCSVIPNMDSNTEEMEKKCPVFYGDISKISDSDQYKNIVLRASDTDFVDEIIREIYHNSEVCIKKTKKYRMAVIISLAAIGLNVLGIILFVVIRVIA